jgi:GTPase SAR1 family protein
MFIEKVNITLKDPIIPKQLKIMFVGDSGVGKSTLINYFVNEEENILLNRTEETNSVDLYFKKIKIKEGSLLLNVNRNF